MRSVFWCTTASLFALAGCSVGQDYTTPSLDAPASFATPASADTIDAAPAIPLTTEPITPAALGSWWRSLNDPELDRLVLLAMNSNLDLRLASQRVMESAAARGIDASLLFPVVDASASATRTRDSQNLINFAGAELERARFGVGLDAAWEIDVFGRVRRSLEAANAELDATIEDSRDVLSIIVADVVRAYIDARTYQARIGVAVAAINAQQETLELTESRHRAGLTSEVDVAQARAQLARRQGLLPILHIGRRAAIHRLGVLIGLAPDALLDKLALPGEVPVPTMPVASGLPSELLSRRPDIRRAERELAAAVARVGVATADLYPRFTLLGTAGLASQHAGDLFEAQSRIWSIGPGVQWNLFDAGRRRASVRAANARAAQAMTRYERSMLLALEDVENAMVAFVQLQARERALAQAVNADERAVELATDRYRSGVGDFLSVLDAQRQLFDTRDLLADARGSVSNAFVRLSKSLGGGWSLGPESTAQPQDQKDLTDQVEPSATGG